MSDGSDNCPTDANADQADSDDVSILQVCQMVVTIVLQMLMQTILIQMMFQYCRCVRW